MEPAVVMGGQKRLSDTGFQKLLTQQIGTAETYKSCPQRSRYSNLSLDRHADEHISEENWLTCDHAYEVY